MNNEFETTSFIYIAVSLLFFAIAMVRYGRAGLGQRIKFMMLWVVILLFITAAYTYWPDVKGSKLYASLVPGTVITNKAGEMEVRKAEDGHFYIDSVVNGKDIRFMVDTGATDIVLSQKDASKLGFDVNALEYNKIYSTANGSTRGASVKISLLKVQDFELNDIYVSVNQGNLDGSLLGMAFLSKFSSYKVEGDKLVLLP